MSIYETIFIGVIVAMFSALAGIVIGKTGKVSKEDCVKTREACNTIICNELKHIKDEQKEMKFEQQEMKKDIKELLKRIKIDN